MRSYCLAAIAAVGLALGLTAPATAQPSPAPSAACRYTGGAATIETPSRPFMTVASADGCWLFVAMGALDGAKIGGGGVAALHNEGGSFKLAHVAPVKDFPGGLALSHDGRTLAVATGESVAIVDVARLEAGDEAAMTASLPMGAGSVYAAISDDDRLLFVSEERLARLIVLDFAKARAAGEKAEVASIETGRAPVGLAFSANGRVLFATSETFAGKTFPTTCEAENGGHGQHPEGILTIIDVRAVATDPAKASLGVRKAGCNPVRVALSPDGQIVWVTARGENKLEGFSTAKLAGLVTDAPDIAVKVGPSPVGLAVRPDGAQVWVANSNRFGHNRPGSLTAVSPTGQVLRTVPTGVFPRDIGFLPDGKTLVVAQFESRAVQFVPTDAP